MVKILHPAQQEFFAKCFKNQDINMMCRYLYDKPDLTFNDKQLEIMKPIVFRNHKRVLGNCFTRFGKSFCVGSAVGLYILFNANKRIIIGSHTVEQAKVIRDTFASMMNSSKILRRLLVENKRSNSEKDFKQEVSKTKFVFKNGCEISIKTFNDNNKSAMGFGADLLIVDELGLISRDMYYSVISRMLGDDPENSVFIGLFNPWSVENISYDLWNSGRYHCVHADWRYGLKVGRITKNYIEEKKYELRNEPTKFEVLYESKFPSDLGDIVIHPEQIKKAFENNIKTWSRELFVGIDVARQGNDRSVITIVRDKKILSIHKFRKLHTVQLMSKVKIILQKFVDEDYNISIAVDDDGVGGGLTDVLNSLFEWTTIQVVPIHNGGVASANTRFSNRITEIAFWLKENIRELDFPHDEDIVQDFSKRLFGYDTTQRLRIESKKSLKKRGIASPDVGDSICYAYSFYTDYFQGEDGITLFA